MPYSVYTKYGEESSEAGITVPNTHFLLPIAERCHSGARRILFWPGIEILKIYAEKFGKFRRLWTRGQFPILYNIVFTVVAIEKEIP